MVITVINLPGQLIMLSVSLIPYLLNKKHKYLFIYLPSGEERNRIDECGFYWAKKGVISKSQCPRACWEGQAGRALAMADGDLLPCFSQSSARSSARHCHSYSSSGGSTA